MGGGSRKESASLLQKWEVVGEWGGGCDFIREKRRVLTETILKKLPRRGGKKVDGDFRFLVQKPERRRSVLADG